MKTEIGRKLRILRKRLGLTQKQFAERIEGKVDYTYIGKIERGEQYPSLKMLERIGKAFSTPVSYFFENNTILSLFNLLPGEIKELLEDRKKQDLLIMSKRLNERDLDLALQIIRILSQEKPLRYLQLAEKKVRYGSLGEEKKKYLIKRIEEVLASSPPSLSFKEDWVKESLRIALQALKGN
ncbi:helix-turn-helix transcriptional regulator [Candidatus Aerophobetes bacterium]|nr:helix-turn-helix transcriptional regulator [Candidatus Aerophobetes bacterium]